MDKVKLTTAPIIVSTIVLQIPSLFKLDIKASNVPPVLPACIPLSIFTFFVLVSD
jgi:hypothetical protein